MSSLKTILKASVFSICALASIHTSYAGPNEDRFNTDMDKWQAAYPVLAQVREDLIFKGISKGALARAKSGTTVDVMKSVLPAFTKFIFTSGLYSDESETYFPIIEYLAPVARDFFGMGQQSPKLPVLEQCESLYIIHSIFHDGERMIDESSRKNSTSLQEKENSGLDMFATKAEPSSPDRTKEGLSRSFTDASMTSTSPSKRQAFTPAKGNVQDADISKQLVY